MLSNSPPRTCKDKSIERSPIRHRRRHEWGGLMRLVVCQECVRHSAVSAQAWARIAPAQAPDHRCHCCGQQHMRQLGAMAQQPLHHGSQAAAQVDGAMACRAPGSLWLLLSWQGQVVPGPEPLAPPPAVLRMRATHASSAPETRCRCRSRKLGLLHATEVHAALWLYSRCRQSLWLYSRCQQSLLALQTKHCAVML